MHSLLRPSRLALLATTLLFGSAAWATQPEPKPKAGAAPATAAQPAKAGDLQVLVDVPPAWNPIVEDDIAEALAGVLSERFRRRGYKGVVDFIDQRRRAPNPDIPLLVIHLQEWRLGRAGSADCTFSATLRLGSKETNLGLFSGTRMTWVSETHRWNFLRDRETYEALEEAAEAAMNDLYRKIAETGTVRGLELKKK